MVDFMKYKPLYLAISGTLIIASIASLIAFQLKPAIDFTGGSLLEVALSEHEYIGSEELTNAIQEVEGVQVFSVQTSGEDTYIVRMGSMDEVKKNEIENTLIGKYGTLEERRFETVGPTLGRELLIKTGVAILIASIAILIYVAYQFKDKVYGISAVVAMFHDTIILVGAFSIFGYLRGVEVDMLFVTALLTTLSFSVHDTIVVFDRIRETYRTNPRARYSDVVNIAILETLPRSLNNSMTIIFMLTSLAVLGGDTIRWFAIALLIGTIAGTYSSTFVAAPLLDTLMKKLNKAR